MNDVPRWQGKFISEFYFETYHYLYPDVPHFSQLNNEQSFMLAALIYGDLLERWPILKDAQNYVQNGNKAGISGPKNCPIAVCGYRKQGLFLFYECGEPMGWYGRW